MKNGYRLIMEQRDMIISLMQDFSFEAKTTIFHDV